MSGKTILYIIVVIYIVSKVARCDLAKSLSSGHESRSQGAHGALACCDG